MMKVLVTVSSLLTHFHLLIILHYYNVQVGIVFNAFSQHKKKKLFTKKKYIKILWQFLQQFVILLIFFLVYFPFIVPHFVLSLAFVNSPNRSLPYEASLRPRCYLNMLDNHSQIHKPW